MQIISAPDFRSMWHDSLSRKNKNHLVELLRNRLFKNVSRPSHSARTYPRVVDSANNFHPVGDRNRIADFYVDLHLLEPIFFLLLASFSRRFENIFLDVFWNKLILLLLLLFLSLLAIMKSSLGDGDEPVVQECWKFNERYGNDDGQFTGVAEFYYSLDSWTFTL